MKLYDTARKLKRIYKRHVKAQAGKFLSPVRRLERVAPPSDGRYAAMTFDDGPDAAPTNPKRSGLGLTEDLLQTLGEFGAKGTFDVIGSTAENYPDEAGPIGTFNWGGITYDHYPDFGSDKLGGAVNQPDLIEKMLREGHEITSHTFRHILFGPNRLIYGKRQSYPGLPAVIDDLKLLHQLLEETYDYTMRMSRPPHYIDKTRDGRSAYDAYRYMNYQYMAASFDGGGWQISGDYQKDVDSMVAPMKALLEQNPDSLNGQIIFQKDGCNMSRQTPIADALKPQLELLTQHGYKVITVSDLIARSPFEDTPDTDPVHPHAAALLRAGHCVAHKNNTLQPDKPMNLGELLMMLADPQELLFHYREWVDGGFVLPDDHKIISGSWMLKPEHPYFHAFVMACNKGLLLSGNPKNQSWSTALTHEMFGSIMREYSGNRSIRAKGVGTVLTKRDVLEPLAATLLS